MTFIGYINFIIALIFIDDQCKTTFLWNVMPDLLSFDLLLWNIMLDLLSFDSLLWNVMLDFVINNPNDIFQDPAAGSTLSIVCLVYHESKKEMKRKEGKRGKEKWRFLSWLIPEKIQRKEVITCIYLIYIVVKRWKKIINMYLKWHICCTEKWGVRINHQDKIK